MVALRKLPPCGPALETGLIQPTDGWPGLFIRADEAHALAAGLKSVLHYAHAPSPRMAEAQRLLGLLESCDARKLAAALAAEADR